MPVLGIPLALTSYEETMDWMDARVTAGDRVFLCAAAVHLVMVAQEDPEVREAVLSHDLVLPDGVPLVWAQRALGHREASRVYGPDLMARYFERSVHSGVRH
jgi:N-acetylglucosaminyldiphosphoundecaprenol N-acetyl-beta-D-mannosaminyltransferase